MKTLKASDMIPVKEYAGTLSMADIMPTKQDEQPKVSRLGAGLAGYSQGISLGWADEVDNWISEKMPWYDDFKAKAGNEYSKAIVEGRKLGIKPSEIRQQYEAEAKGEYPGTSITGQIGGGLITSLVPGMAISRGTTLGTRLATGAAGGATYGGIEGAGLAKEDKLGGAGMGFGMGALGGAALPALGATGRVAKDILTPAAKLTRDLLYKTGEVVSGIPEGALKTGIRGKEIITKKMDIPLGGLAPELKQSANELLQKTIEGKNKAIGILKESGLNMNRSTIHSTIRDNFINSGESIPPKTIEKVYGFIEQYLEPKNKYMDTMYGPMATGEKAAEFSYDYVRKIIDGMQDQINFSKMSRDTATEKAYKIAQSALNNKILKDLEPFPEYQVIWDDVIKNADTLSGVAGIKKTDILFGSKETGNLARWDSYIDKVIKDAKKEIVNGDNRGREITKLKAFDQLMGTAYTKEVEDKAIFTLMNPPGASGDVMSKLRAFSAPASRTIINTLQGGRRVAEAGTQGLDSIASKFSGTKWGGVLTDSLKKDGTRGMAATHMMLMATDKDYRKKAREE